MAPNPVYRLYPNPSSMPHRDSIGSDGRPVIRRERSKINSFDTAIHSPSGTNDVVNDGRSHDFLDRYNHQRRDTVLSTGIVLKQQRSSGSSSGSDAFAFPSGNDDTSQSAAAPAEFGNWRSHKLRTSTSTGHLRKAGRPLPINRARSPVRYETSVSTPSSPTMTDNHSVYDPSARSSGASFNSVDTMATSISTLAPLQSRGPDCADMLEPVLEDDPSSWDLVSPPQSADETGVYALEKRAEQLFSADHLKTIFEDPKLLLKFTGFLNSHRPQSVPLLIYYLDATKALRAISYANAIAESLAGIKGHDFTEQSSKPTKNTILQEKAKRAFAVLVQEDLPAFVAHTWTHMVSVSAQRRITGTLAPHLREASEGLAEVFCLTDPSRTDNPIIFASEEFARTTQYGMNYAIGRNCRFLQGPRTNPNSVRRLAMACAAGKEHTEVFVNYRRDGSPFINLLMIAPLMDSRGVVRYNIGAQVDVSGLLRDCSGLEALTRLVEKEQNPQNSAEDVESRHKDEFQELSEMFNGSELNTVRKYGGRMHKEYVDDEDLVNERGGRPRLLLKNPSEDSLDERRRNHAVNQSLSAKELVSGKLSGVYQNYLLLRPAPSLRILFTSPSLRVPGILQSPFINRIGGSARVRANLVDALAEGQGVTAKIRWLTRPDENGEGEGRPRWIHCTPLIGHSGAVGVWMVVLVDDDSALSDGSSARRTKQAPPVSTNIGGKEWDATAARERKHLADLQVDHDRAGAKSQSEMRGAKESPRQQPSSDRAASRAASRAGAKTPAGPSSESEFSFNL
ncbi:unnamed protein product [Zymoseptoria tritici ST99CH_1A5]|uniref:PAS domain-containing protein n=4 Tax=Zymoseptoria tritici TaxID=1047171 RepID=A0A1X7RQS9_ZYMT9|nr:unnamed protein product [Zymoseptoria tritici ST99CH_3D7]SMR50776.1 unnamed protein product [Zymoseptoria tritici ST99CH_1E4]SMR51717.1 unnamed protein product [Zymoseptoria tritici ST99CH_3D1]SMY23480.1 unnamed protein product [Zymoseptoria tritici ST99CH_1A5]